MQLILNKQKFKIFLQVAKELNRAFDIVPILYGSLGLNRVIGEFKKANDIDVLVPDDFLQDKWNELILLMQDLGFKLKDEHEHEFEKQSEIIGFAPKTDLIKMAKINPADLKISEVNNIKFKELSPEQYLKVYEFMLRDEYRQEKRGSADQEKIELIKKYLKIR